MDSAATPDFHLGGKKEVDNFKKNHPMCIYTNKLKFEFNTSYLREGEI